MKNQPRQALKYSLIYSIPLVFWLTTQLQFITWNSTNLQLLFSQTLIALLLLQVFSITLLLINRVNKTWAQDGLGILHILFFPLPFFTLIWLTGSVSLNNILYSQLMIAIIGILGIVTRIGVCLIPPRFQVLKIIQSLVPLLLAILMWNFRDLWLHWLEL